MELTFRQWQKVNNDLMDKVRRQNSRTLDLDASGLDFARIALNSTLDTLKMVNVINDYLFKYDDRDRISLLTLYCDDCCVYITGEESVINYTRGYEND